MPEKLLTLKELAEYLGKSESEVKPLVDSGVIPAYRIGGSFLRFRKDQIDAIKNEIVAKNFQVSAVAEKIEVRVTRMERSLESANSVGDKLLDFLYFNDFYIVSICAIAFLIYLILKM